MEEPSFEKPEQTDPQSPSVVWRSPWAKDVSILLGCILLLVAAYVFGTKYYYQVYPKEIIAPPQNTQNQNSNTDWKQYALPFDEAFAKAHLDSTCDSASISDEYSRVQSDVYMPVPTLNDIEKQLCAQLAKNGMSAFTNTTQVPSEFYENQGEHLGIGFVQLSDKVVLVEFALVLSGNNSYLLSPQSIRLLPDFSSIKTVSIDPFSESDVPNSYLLTINGLDANGKAVTQYRTEKQCKNCDEGFDALLVRNDDGSFSTVIDDQPGRGNGTLPKSLRVHVLMPYSTSFNYYQLPSRDYGMEQTSISPIYHKASCGLEDVYSDETFGFYTANSDSVAIDINLGLESRLHITTPESGYVPEQWGKILQDIDLSEFIQKVQTPRAYNSNAPAEMRTIGGYQVKHIGPITLDRTCQNNSDATLTADMYQAVKNNAVVSFTFGHSSDGSPVSPEKIITQVLNTLTITQ